VSRVVEELLGHELAIAPSFDQGVQGPLAVGGKVAEERSVVVCALGPR
jgi:hypothetical protein